MIREEVMEVRARINEYHPGELRDWLLKSLMALETAWAERDNWEDAAAQYHRNAEYYAGLLDEIGKTFGEEAYITDEGTRNIQPLRAKLIEVAIGLQAERVALTKERDFLSLQNTELLGDTTALKAKVEKLETAMKKIASGMAIDGWGDRDTLDRTDLMTIAGICLTEQNILKERHGSPT